MSGSYYKEIHDVVVHGGFRLSKVVCLLFLMLSSHFNTLQAVVCFTYLYHEAREIVQRENIQILHRVTCCAEN